MSEPRATVFEVLDAVGLAKLDKRSGDLDGGVPVRVAQACSPLLEGNAFGFHVSLSEPVAIERSFGRVRAIIDAPRRDAVEASYRAAAPRLLAEGVVAKGSASSALVEGGLVSAPKVSVGRARFRLWTGLLVKPDKGVWLRISSGANRRNRFFEVEETFIDDDGAFTPLVLDITLRKGAPDVVRLAGEIATIAPVSPQGSIEDTPLAEAKEVGEAHVAFYDAAYFASKKGEPTRKYRKMKTPNPRWDPEAPARSRVIAAGPSAHVITREARIVGQPGLTSMGPPRVVFSNLVPFEATYDGYSLVVTPDRRALDAGARAVEAMFGSVFGPGFVEGHRGALWYLTKYVTPHPPGEPHFFVKPWAFVATPPGVSSLIEGVHGEGFDVLRGVVSTDVFHATPAVFHVFQTGDPIRVGAGEPLVSVIPVPRALLRAGYRSSAWAR